jgi:hypothetical protein
VRSLTRDRRRLERLLLRIERQVEWGLRLTFDESADDPPRPPAAGRRRSGTAPVDRSESGLEYLSRKRDRIEGHSRRLRHARTEGNRLYRALAREATGAVRRQATERAAPGSRLLVDAAFLVPVARTRAFRSILRRHARAVGDAGVVVVLTGPWPPYHFAGQRRGASS